MVSSEKELEKMLCGRLQVTASQLLQVFLVEQRADDSFTVSFRDDWIDKPTWMTVNDLVREQRGEWDPKARLWTVPYKEEPRNEIRKPTKETVNPQAQEKQVPAAETSSDEYDLSLSKQKLGELIPILTDAHGNIIDGFHREQIDPNWTKVKAEHIIDPVQLAMARLAANVCRRRVPAEEKTRLLGNIAELTGWSAEQIAEALGMSYQWVTKYLPSEFKDKEKVMAGQMGGATIRERYEFALQRRAESQDIRQQTSHEEPADSSSQTEPQFHEEPEEELTIEGQEEPLDSSSEQEPFEAQSITPTVQVEKIDTGVIFTCPECGWQATHIHIKPSGKHKLEEVREL